MERVRTHVRAVSNPKNILKGTKNNLLRQYLTFMALILLGIIIGSLYIRTAGIKKSVLDGTGLFMQDILSAGTASKGFFNIAIAAFFPSALIISFAYIFGLCAIGFPFEFVLPVSFGAFTGASLASIYVRFGARGLGICLLFIMPQALINSIAVIVASKEGFKLSRQISQIVIKAAQKNLTSNFRTYCFKILVCFLFSIVASIIEALSIILFSKMFLS